MLDRARLRDDLAHFADSCLTIRGRSGAATALRFNAAQQAIHAAAEAARAATGRVRIVALKARQLGFSTYVQARFYHRVMQTPGVRAFILTHAAPATANLFAIAARFQAGCPLEIRPPIKSQTSTAMTFAGLESSYRVGTARTGAVGRSDTIQLFHGSEVAFWPRAQDHIAGALQAVPAAAETEVWLESTLAAGDGGVFRALCLKAIKGAAPFRFLFAPWFWADHEPAAENTEPVDADEADLIAQNGLHAGRLAWRRAKIAELGADSFRHEYPATPEDALAADHPATAIDRRLIRAAVARGGDRPPAPIVWGLSPGRFRDARAMLAKRSSDRLIDAVEMLAPAPANPADVVTATIAVYARTHAALRPQSIFVAATGSGGDIATALRQSGLPAVDVDPGATPPGDGRFVRRRDALWWAAREWFSGRRCEIPDDIGLILDLSAPLRRVTPEGQIEIETVDETRARLGFVPDAAEAFVLTFAGG